MGQTSCFSYREGTARPAQLAISCDAHREAVVRVQPTPSMVEVANGYLAESETAVKRLQSDTAAARAVLKH